VIRGGGRIGIGLALAVVLLLDAAPALAQHVELKLEQGPHYAGDAIELQLVATGFEEEPTPEIDVEVGGGATLQPMGVSPNVNQQIQIVNGRMTRSRTVTFVYRYLLTAHAPGRISVGPFVVRQGSQVRSVPPTPLQIGKISASNEVFVSLDLPKGPFYVGQHVPVKLRFELTRDLQKTLETYSLGVPLFMRTDGVRFVDLETRGDTLTDIVIQTPKGPIELKGVVREVTVANKPGLSVESERILIPTESGVIDAAPATIVAERATHWRRDLFGQRIATRTKKMRAAGRAHRFEVHTVPTEGRPPGFAGAVGKDFTLDVSAERSVVQVGEPIAIELVLRGEGALESASLPRLDAPGLLPSEQFRVPDEMPTGVVEENGSKRFRVTVRVLDEQVDALPALEYSWFDPEVRDFATTRSRPIALSVTPGRTIGADDVIGGSPGPEPTSALSQPEAEVAGESGEADPSGRVFDASGADLSIETDLTALTAATGSVVKTPALVLLYAVGIALAGLGGWAGRRARLDPRMVALRTSLDAELARVQAVGRTGGGSAQAAARGLAAAIRRMHALAPNATPVGLDRLLGELDSLAYAPESVAVELNAEIAERALEVARELAATPFETAGGRAS